MRIAKVAACAMLLGGAALAQAPTAPPAGVLAGEPPAPPIYTAPPGMPVENRPPNARGQLPAFKEQTRAPNTPSNLALKVETVAEGLKWPWGMAFLPDGRILVTERDGTMRIVSGSQVSAPVEGLPPVHVQETYGLADVVLDPRFKTNHLIYWTFSEKREGVGTSVARGRLVDGPTPRVEDVKVIYCQVPDLKSEHISFGGRMAFDRSGALIVTFGDLFTDAARPYIQRLDSSVGKIVRITTDGKPASGNPFIGKAGALPEIWAIGFRNPLSIAFRPGTQDLWTTDVGPFGGDEVNHIKAGGNYGWPVIGYGKEYNGKQIGDGTVKAGYEQPVYYWDPVISPSSLTFYSGNLFPQWKGNAFVTSLSQRHLVRLVLNGEKVIGEERLLADRRERLREVKQGPDGALYILTDYEKGKLLRVTPGS